METDTTDSRSVTLRATLPIKSSNASLRVVLTDRLLLSEALRQVGNLVEYYPNGKGQAGKGYIGAIAATLCTYPRQVALKCCSLDGVCLECEFIPKVANIVAYCERETELLRKPVDREDREHQFREEAKAREEDEIALMEARTTRPTYAQLKAIYGPYWGLKTMGTAQIPIPTRDQIKDKWGYSDEQLDAMPDGKVIA